MNTRMPSLDDYPFISSVAFELRPDKYDKIHFTAKFGNYEFWARYAEFPQNMSAVLGEANAELMKLASQK